MMLRRSLKLLPRCHQSKSCVSVVSFNSPRFMSTASSEPEVLHPMNTTPVTHDFQIIDTTENPTWPMFQMMDLYGVQVSEAPSIDCEENVAVEMYTVMARLKALDDVFYNAQVKEKFYLRII